MEHPKGRVTLRMESSNVKRMDTFLDRSRDFESRSQLMRAALENYIDLLERKSDEVVVKLGGSSLEIIDEFVDAGYYVSRSEGVAEAVRKYFDKNIVNKIREDLIAIGKATNKIPTVRLKDRDEYLSP
ncbi:MAG: ribbon-helix-helix domain-containing protein [Thermoplasmata archaeon]